MAKSLPKVESQGVTSRVDETMGNDKVKIESHPNVHKVIQSPRGKTISIQYY